MIRLGRGDHEGRQWRDIVIEKREQGDKITACSLNKMLPDMCPPDSRNAVMFAIIACLSLPTERVPLPPCGDADSVSCQ